MVGFLNDDSENEQEHVVVRVDGMMRRAFVVGHPIDHSRSPLIHRYWLKELGIDGSYEAIDVAPDRFGVFLDDLSTREFVGGNVTIPHKQEAFSQAHILTARAQKIGAVNTLVIDDNGQVCGDNTDATGFIAHLDQSLGHDWLDRMGDQAVILGAGGAARAIVVGLLERGMRRIVVANRTRSRSDALLAIDPERVTAIGWGEVSETLTHASLLVNTTSLGMTGHPERDLDLDLLPPHAAVADIVYVPLETRLLAAARARGLTAVDGLGMLLHQAVPGFEAWFGTRPSVSNALRRAVIADLNGR